MFPGKRFRSVPYRLRFNRVKVGAKVRGPREGGLTSEGGGGDFRHTAKIVLSPASETGVQVKIPLLGPLPQFTFRQRLVGAPSTKERADAIMRVARFLRGGMDSSSPNLELIIQKIVKLFRTVFHVSPIQLTDGLQYAGQ